MRLVSACLTIFACLALNALAEDTIVLKNQSEITGRIVSDNGDQIVVEIPSPRGSLTIPYADISTINGLSAERLSSWRRTADRAEKLFASHGIAIPHGVRKETRHVASFTEHLGSQPPPASSTVSRFQGLARFHLVPDGWDPAAGITRWRSSARYAVWDAEASTLRLIVSGTADAARFEPFWNAAGRRPEVYPITREVGRMALSRMFGLAKKKEGSGDWDDRALALEAAETGLASAMALDAVLDPPGLSPGQGDAAVQLTTLVGNEEPRGTPVFLHAWRTFAEQEGARFFRTARFAGGWSLCQRVFEDLPASTEQIMHPEKYFAARDNPTRVELPVPSVPDGAGRLSYVWGGSSLGEWMILQSFLAPAGEGKAGLDGAVARRAAAGWDGDNWIVMSSPAGGLALLWFTVWDTPEDAREFAEAEADAALLRTERGKKNAEAGRILLDTSEGYGLIEWKDREVVVVESIASPEGAAKFAADLWRTAVRRDDTSEGTAKAPAADIATALAVTDELAQAWPADPPRSEPLSGVVETDPKTKSRVFTAAGSFRITIPDDWDVRTEPTALILAPKTDGGGLTVTITWHRAGAGSPPLLVYARAWAVACPKGDGFILPYDTKTDDGRGWFQFVLPNPDRRVHLAWTVSGDRLIRVEATAPAAGAPEGIRLQLQSALASLKFLR